MHSLDQIAELRVLYPEYELKNYDEVLKGISKDSLIRVLTYLIGKDLYSGKEIDNTEVIENWFSKDNKVFAEDAYRRIVEYEQQHGRKLTVVTVIGCLQVLQRSFELEEQGALNTKSNEHSEIDLFFALLLANQQEDENHTRDGAKIAAMFPDHTPEALLFHYGFATGDIVNFHYKDYTACQIVKALLLFKFLESREDAQELLQRFYKYYGVQHWKEYMGSVIPMALAWSQSTEKSSVDLVLEPGPGYAANYDFLRRMALSDYVRLEDMDYLKLRAKPLIELDPHTFRIIHPLFVSDKIYKGLYFLFNQLNSEQPQLIKEFRTWYTTHFSEEVSFRKLFEYALPGSDVMLFDAEIKQRQAAVIGPPDGYIRTGNKTFLLESKDILINAKIKVAYDFENTIGEIQKKLYEKDGKPIGLGQLVTNTRKLLDGTNTYDPGFKVGQTIIYPLLIAHDAMFDASGLNRLLGIYFAKELRKLKVDGLDVSTIRPLIVMNIDLLIQIADLLKDNKLTLEEVCEAYYNNFTFIPRDQFASDEDYMQAYRNTLVSFHDFAINYINNKLGYDWKSENLMRHLFKE